MPDIHLKYGGSTINRTLNCPAWVNLAATAPKLERSSAAADRGTKLHAVMEHYYNQFEHPIEHFIVGLEEKDQDAVMTAYHAAEALLSRYQVDAYECEPMAELVPGLVGGSIDMIAAGPDHCVILDWKFGYQAVTNNTQQKLYAIAAMATPELQDLIKGRKIVTAIIQPAVSENATTLELGENTLTDFTLDVGIAVTKGEEGADKGVPGDWCKYCPAGPYCPEKRAQATRFLALDKAHGKQLAEGMSLVAQMKEMIKAIEGEVFIALEHGENVPGWKLVPKQARRHWIDEDTARHKLRYSKLGKEYYIEETLRSPAQVEAACKKQKVNVSMGALITKKSSGTTIAPESDKRAAIEVKGAVPAALAAVLDGPTTPE